MIDEIFVGGNMIFTQLETSRLFLKNIDQTDRAFIFSQFSDDDVNRYLFDAEPLTNIEEADDIIGFYTVAESRFQHRWILVRKEDGIKIGTCGFHCWDQKNRSIEMGYDLKKDFWGHGYMTEALKEIIDFAVNAMQIKSIQACISVDNSKSIDLIKKLGFVLTGSKDEHFRGKPYPHHLFTYNHQ